MGEPSWGGDGVGSSSSSSGGGRGGKGGSQLRWSRQPVLLVSPPGSPHLNALDGLPSVRSRDGTVLGNSVSSRSSSYRSTSPIPATLDRTISTYGSSPSPRSVSPSPRIRPEEQEYLSASFSWLKTHWATKEQEKVDMKRDYDLEKEEAQIGQQQQQYQQSHLLINRPRAQTRTINHHRALYMAGLLIGLTIIFGLFIRTTDSDASGSGPDDAAKSAVLVDPYVSTSHLIMVPGHAVRRLGRQEERTDVLSPDSWIVQDFVTPGQVGDTCDRPCQTSKVRTFVRHIGQGLHQLDQEPKGEALLVFSGGQTRAEAGPISEGLSYWATARALFENSNSAYMTTEEYAKDSYENLIFSIARFREMTGHYPDKITIVGFEFKKSRFIELHARGAAQWGGPIHYIGIDEATPLSEEEKSVFGPLVDDSTPIPLVTQADSSRSPVRDSAYADFQTDLYGCHTKSLVEKRLSRNPWHRQESYVHSAPEMRQLLEWCPPTSRQGIGRGIFRGVVPWKRP